jgi:acetyltransferase
MGIANSNRGVGFSTLISSGNEAALDNADYIAYLVDDPQTRVIIAFIEGFKGPDKFVRAAERARQAGKPLLVVKIGRSAVAQCATLAHTGSLAGSDAVHDAVFRKHGIIRLQSLDELLETAELFLNAPLPAGRGIGFLTLSGGQIGLIGDMMQEFDLILPKLSEEARRSLAEVLPPYSNLDNPLDAWGSGNFEETYPACIEILAHEKDIHLLAVARDSAPGIAPREIWQSNVIIDAAAQAVQTSGKPCVVFSNIATGFEKAVQDRAHSAGLPLIQGTRASLRAIAALMQYADFTRQPPRQPGSSPVGSEALTHIRNSLSCQPPSLSEHAGKQLLAAYGVPITREALATSCDQAIRFAQELDVPVALKIQSPDIQHKTEAKGVALNLQGADAIRRAYNLILENARHYKPDARIEGVLVQEMIPADAVEVIVGSSNDRDFGPMVVFGLGGILVELFKDSVLRPAPVSLEEAHEMVASVRSAALLRGFRGRPPADVCALADVIRGVSHLAHDLRAQIAAVDINPLMVLPQGRGVRAADALIVRSNIKNATDSMDSTDSKKTS